MKSEGQPIPGATVRATQGDRILLTLTNENGAFEFPGLTPGAWNIDVDMFGFERLHKEVQIASTPTRIDLTLTLREARRGPQAQTRATEEPLDTGQMSAMTAEAPSITQAPQVDAGSANESLTISGTVSNGLQNTSDFGGFGPGGFGGQEPGDQPQPPALIALAGPNDHDSIG